MYKEALKKENSITISHTVQYLKVTMQKEVRTWEKVIWFNPTYSMKLNTKFVKTFLKLGKSNFLNISHSCMRNNSSVIHCIIHFASQIKGILFQLKK